MSEKIKQLKTNIKFAQLFKLGKLLFNTENFDYLVSNDDYRHLLKNFQLLRCINNGETIENINSQLLYHVLSNCTDDSTIDVFKTFKYKLDFQFFTDQYHHTIHCNNYKIADKFRPYKHWKVEKTYPVLINYSEADKYQNLCQFLVDDYIIPALYSDNIFNKLHINLFTLIVSIVRHFILLKENILDKLICEYINYLKSHSFSKQYIDESETLIKSIDYLSDDIFKENNLTQHMCMNLWYHKFWWNLTEHQFITLELLAKYFKYIPSVYHFGNLLYINPNKSALKKYILTNLPYQVKDCLNSSSVRSKYTTDFNWDGSLSGYTPSAYRSFTCVDDIKQKIQISYFYFLKSEKAIDEDQIWKNNFWFYLK